MSSTQQRNNGQELPRTPACPDYIQMMTDSGSNTTDLLRSSLVNYAKTRREKILHAEKTWYYKTFLQYLNCVDAKVVVLAGANDFGSLAEYLMKSDRWNQLEELHIVHDVSSNKLPGLTFNASIAVQTTTMSAATKTTDDGDLSRNVWSVALYQSLVESNTVYEVSGTTSSSPLSDCKLRIHCMSFEEIVQNFQNDSVDVVFLQGPGTYADTMQGIDTWTRVVHNNGGAVIVNGFDQMDAFPGVAKATLEKGDQWNKDLRSLDDTNVALGGSSACAVPTRTALPNQMQQARSISVVKEEEDEVRLTTASSSGVTPSCIERQTPQGSTGKTLQRVVDNFAQRHRNEIQVQGANGPAWHYPTLVQYYKCAEAKVIVHVGAGFGAVAQYMLKHHGDSLVEYHLVDPFVVGHAMAKEIRSKVPDATTMDISKAWASSIQGAISTYGEYLEEGMDPVGCKLRIHRTSSQEAAKLFQPNSVDAIFVDNHHTYQGITEDLTTWKRALKHGGAMIVTDFNELDENPGVARAVIEYSEHQKLGLRSIDAANVVLGGPATCAVLTTEAAPEQFQKAHKVATNERLEASDELFVSAEGTPPCIKHPSVCDGLCDSIGTLMRDRRNAVQSDIEGSKSWYQSTMLQYYTCMDAKVIIEIGDNTGSHAQYALKHRSGGIRQYHLVDPFQTESDDHELSMLTSGATESSVSQAWADSVRKAIGVDGEFLDEGMEPAGCKFRIHRVDPIAGGALLFGDHAVDVVFINGVYSYEITQKLIGAWTRVVKSSGALIVNGFDAFEESPGIARAVLEEADRRGIQIRSVDATNKVLGGSNLCAHPSSQEEPEQMKRARQIVASSVYR